MSKIAEIDKNFNIETEKSDGLKFYNIPSAPFDLYGVFYEAETKRFVRMPSDVANGVSENVGLLNANTAGGRVRFSTDSERICIRVKYKELNFAPHISLLGGSGFILLEEREDRTVFVYSFMPGYYGNDKDDKSENGYAVTKKTGDGKVKNYILYFPTYNDICELSIGLDDNAFVGHGRKYNDVKPILYYGSSIGQGGCASRADNSYQALISKWTNTDYVNLGFSGSARGEEKMAEYLASIDCSVFVCGYDYNAPTPEFLKDTHYNFYKSYRNKRPCKPVLFVSNPNTDGNYMNAQERFAVIKETYETALAEGDKNVYLLDGSTLFGENDRENCTVDGCHPNDLGFYRIAQKIYSALKEICFIAPKQRDRE